MIEYADILLQVVKTEEDDQFLASLLGEVDQNIPAAAPRHSKKRDRSMERRRARIPSSAPEPRRPAVKRARLSDVALPTQETDIAFIANDDGAFILMDEDEALPPPLPANDVPGSDPAPSSPTVKVVERMSKLKAEAEDDEDDDMMEVAYAGAINAASVNMSASRVPQKLVKAEAYLTPANSSPPKNDPEPAIDSSAWNEINSKLNVVSSSPTEAKGLNKIDYKDAIEEDGSLNMFWTDYTEVNGSLCLFGKVLNKKTRSYVSCFVKVDNILRKLYFLPRQHRVVRGQETSEEVEMMDVYTEIDTLMTKMNVGMFKIKGCTRKYAFELPDIPKEGQYMKVFYPYNSKIPCVCMGVVATDIPQSLKLNRARLERLSRMFSAPIRPYSNNSFCGRTSWVLVG